MENEIKIAFPSKESLFQTVEQPWFREAVTFIDEKNECYDNRYLDTTGRDLRQTRTSIRVRQVLGHEYIHTVKTGGVQIHDGLSSKYEWNWVTEEHDFDIQRFISAVEADCPKDPIAVLKEVLLPIEGQPLIDLCRTSFSRRTIRAKYQQSEVEICLDVGECYGLDRHTPIIEMEIELVEGSVAEITSLGEQIVSRTGASYEEISKLGRCLLLLEEVEHDRR
ncbi:MAG: CYTH domain-containing protein [Clostridiales bacterium]|nr:CYTH domain-containing protein [Candidatus Scatonaster coprocaballi]